MAQHHERIATRPHITKDVWQTLVERVLPVVICCALILWLALIPGHRNPTSPPSALIALGIMSLATALIMRGLRSRFGLSARAALELPDPLYMLYLATAVLVGAHVAVAFALVASLLVGLPDSAATPRQWAAALRQAVAAGCATLIAAGTYTVISQLLAPNLSLLHAHLIGALAASVVMLLGASIIRALEQSALSSFNSFGWRSILATPAIRFQALMLAIGPLLPLADVLDDVEAELAWGLFLVPLFAMYYLALVSTRLEQRKTDLQQTIEELRVARRREAELTDYAALITRAQEEERRRLARELHDDTAQALVALARGLDSLSTQTSYQARPAQDARFVEDLSGLAKRSLESIRRACQDLRPSVLDDLGLSPALESLVSATAQRGLPCDFTQTGESWPCAPEVEMSIYRIAQEALSNARRHAQATSATLTLAYTPETLRLTVRDNGQGFSQADLPHHLHRAGSEVPEVPGMPESRSGLGLLGMRERAALIGATLEIKSAPGDGTSIVLTVPAPGGG